MNVTLQVSQVPRSPTVEQRIAKDGLWLGLSAAAAALPYWLGLKISN